MSFGICDIVIIALVAIAAITGLVKGFFKRLAGFLAFVGAVIVAFIFYKTVVGMLSGTGLFSTINEKLLNWINGKNEAFLHTIGELGENGIRDAISTLGIPKFIVNFVFKDLTNIVANNGDELLGVYMANLLANYALIAISFFIIFLLAYIVLRIVFGFFKKLADKKSFGAIDKILGLAWGILRSLITVCLIMSLLSFLVGLPGFGDKVNAFITKDMHLEEEGFGIAKYFYLQNPLLAILSKYGLEGLLEYPSANSGIVLNLGLFA